MLPLLVVMTGVGSVLSECSLKTSCDQCMSDSACVWCPDPSITTKCFEAKSADKCSKEIINIKSDFSIVENKPLVSESIDNQFIQIAPQKIEAKLRPGTPVKINFQVAHAKDFPVDLYFLMDLSWSMRKSRENLAKTGGDIISKIKEKTRNLATGFGSFIEKNVQPFTSAISSYNCFDNDNCAPPYSFYHKSSLGNILSDEFYQAVMESPMGGNIDDPEGSLDALMQVMVCGDRIGWRENSRKIIIVSTDRDYHFALDGKLAGIFTANDGQCHLNNTGDGSGYYTEGETLDYPSVSHINSVAQQQNFIIIFAVTAQYQEAYEALAERITGSKVGVLEKDGSNIINIVEEKYDETLTEIKVMENSDASVNISLDTTCGGGSNKLGPNHCGGVALGQSVNFTAQISVSKCLDATETVSIFPLGLNENLTILVESDCDCNCVSLGELSTKVQQHRKLYILS